MEFLDRDFNDRIGAFDQEHLVRQYLTPLDRDQSCGSFLVWRWDEHPGSIAGLVLPTVGDQGHPTGWGLTPQTNALTGDP